MTQRQLAMVINLDKCIGCQNCTVTCRTHWLKDQKGAENMYYMWCETHPGKGWPRDWMNAGKKIPHATKDYGGTWKWNFEEVFTTQFGKTHLKPTMAENGQPPEWGVLWDEDEGGGSWPNGYHFYMPRACNHCTDAPCITACQEYCDKQGKPVAMHKRESDGIVVIDQDKCLSCGVCVSSCPYKVPLKNTDTGAYQMCDMCVTRTDVGLAPACAKSCPARAMSFGYLDDTDSFVHKLVHEYKVALPLRPDFETGANIYYIPPFIRPNFIGEGKHLDAQKDLPIEKLREYFGPGVDQAIETLNEHRARATDGDVSELMQMLIVYKFADAFTPFSTEAPKAIPVKNV